MFRPSCTPARYPRVILYQIYIIMYTYTPNMWYNNIMKLYNHCSDDASIVVRRRTSGKDQTDVYPHNNIIPTSNISRCYNNNYYYYYFVSTMSLRNTHTVSSLLPEQIPCGSPPILFISERAHHTADDCSRTGIPVVYFTYYNIVLRQVIFPKLNKIIFLKWIVLFQNFLCFEVFNTLHFYVFYVI